MESKMEKTTKLFVIFVCEQQLSRGPNPLKNSKPKIAKGHQPTISLRKKSALDHNYCYAHA